MQPHSMCTVGLCNYVWNYYKPVENEYRMSVEYRSEYGVKVLYYRLFNVKVSEDGTELSVAIQRDGGGLACVVHARRASRTEGAEVTMTHETQHVAGLREVYNLYKGQVLNGMHYNSKKYRGFRGQLASKSDPKHFQLTTDLVRADGSTSVGQYDLRIL